MYKRRRRRIMLKKLNKIYCKKMGLEIKTQRHKVLKGSLQKINSYLFLNCIYGQQRIRTQKVLR